MKIVIIPPSFSSEKQVTGVSVGVDPLDFPCMSNEIRSDGGYFPVVDRPTIALTRIPTDDTQNLKIMDNKFGDSQTKTYVP